MTPEREDYHRNPSSPLPAMVAWAVVGLLIWVGVIVVIV